MLDLSDRTLHEVFVGLEAMDCPVRPKHDHFCTESEMIVCSGPGVWKGAEVADEKLTDLDAAAAKVAEASKDHVAGAMVEPGKDNKSASCW